MPLPSRRKRNGTPPVAGALALEGDTRVARRVGEEVLYRGDLGADDEAIAAEGVEHSTPRARLGQGGVA
jgi:hypothetical protein